MSSSLQDQLKALGLAKDKPNKKASPRPRKRPAGEKESEALSLRKAYALKEREEQRQSDQARSKKRAEDRKRREINNEIRKLVNQHRLNRQEAEIGRNFMFKGRIRKVYVTAEQLKALNSGDLGIVYLSGGYHLLPAEQVESVRKLSAQHVPDLSVGSDEDGDHPVPDDLVW